MYCRRLIVVHVGRFAKNVLLNIKPSSELLQTLPDAYDVYSCLPVARACATLAQARRQEWARDLTTGKATEARPNVSSARLLSVTSSANPITTTSSDEARMEASRAELDKLKETGVQIPTLAYKDYYLLCFSELDSFSKKNKFIQFLWKKEYRKAGDKRDKELRRKQYEEKLEKEAEDSDQESSGKRYLMLRRINQTHMTYIRQWNMARGRQFGGNLVLDFSYEHFMSLKEKRHLCKQLLHMSSQLPQHYFPFHLHFTGYSLQSEMQRHLERFIKPHALDWLADVTPRSYLDLFPKEDLVYLSSDSPNVLMRYDPAKVYVAGALVDLQHRSGASMANVKRHGLNSARLPLDLYLKFAHGTKDLTLDQIVAIMQDLKDTGDWMYALRHTPNRKVEAAKSTEWMKDYKGPSIIPVGKLISLMGERRRQPVWGERERAQPSYSYSRARLNQDRSEDRPNRHQKEKKWWLFDGENI